MSDRPSYSRLQTASAASAELAGGDKLRVRFDDDIECVLDVSEAGRGAAIADVEYLQRLSFDSERRKLVWPNGFEIDMDILHARATLRQREVALGPQHPDTLAARFLLACLYVAVGDTEVARDVGEPLDQAPEVLQALAERFFADADRELGAGDPRAQAFRDGLVDVFRVAGGFGDGSTSHEQAD